MQLSLWLVLLEQLVNVDEKVSFYYQNNIKCVLYTQCICEKLRTHNTKYCVQIGFSIWLLDCLWHKYHTIHWNMCNFIYTKKDVEVCTPVTRHWIHQRRLQAIYIEHIQWSIGHILDSILNYIVQPWQPFMSSFVYISKLSNLMVHMTNLQGHIYTIFCKMAVTYVIRLKIHLPHLS